MVMVTLPTYRAGPADVGQRVTAARVTEVILVVLCVKTYQSLC